MFACGNLASVFLFVVACASFHTFIFYKGQSVVQVLLPSHIQDQLVKGYVILSFSLKVSNDDSYAATNQNMPVSYPVHGQHRLFLQVFHAVLNCSLLASSMPAL
jgi:hypothetical protein